MNHSGTTADPRPVEYKHLAYGNAWSFVHLPDINGRRHLYEMMYVLSRSNLMFSCLVVRWDSSHSDIYFCRYPGNSKRILLVTAPWHVLSATTSLPSQYSLFYFPVFCQIGIQYR